VLKVFGSGFSASSRLVIQGSESFSAIGFSHPRFLNPESGWCPCHRTSTVQQQIADPEAIQPLAWVIIAHSLVPGAHFHWNNSIDGS